MTSPTAARTNADGSRAYGVPNADGELISLPGTSTCLSAMDKPGLRIWKEKAIAFGVAQYQDLQEMALEGREFHAAKEALNRTPSAADLGTAVHEFTEAIDFGAPGLIGPDDGAPEVQAYAQAWVQFKEDFDVVAEEIEATVFNHDVSYAGTLDRILRLSGYAGCAVVDIKTGKRIYPDVGLQLASYANAEAIWDAEAGEVRPLPEDLRRDVGFVVHLKPNGTYALVEVALDEAWAAFRSAKDLWYWQNVASKRAITTAQVTPVDELTRERVEWLRSRVNALSSDVRTELARGWPEGVSRTVRELTTDAEIDKVAAALTLVEAAHGLPFHEGDPAVTPKKPRANTAQTTKRGNH